MGQSFLRCILQGLGTGREDTPALRHCVHLRSVCLWMTNSVCEHQRVHAGDAKCNPQLSGITQVTAKLINNIILVNNS